MYFYEKRIALHKYILIYIYMSRSDKDKNKKNKKPKLGRRRNVASP
jgi:hypothetical protein